MNFVHFPLDIQIEILKYNPLFRGVNKTFYDQGYYMFKTLYSNLPITKKEYLNYIQLNKYTCCYRSNLSDMIMITNIEGTYCCSTYYSLVNGKYNSLSTSTSRSVYLLIMYNDYIFDIETTFNIYQLRNLPAKRSDIIKKYLLQGDTLDDKIKNMVYINGLNGLNVLDKLKDKTGEDYLNYIEMMSKY